MAPIAKAQGGHLGRSLDLQEMTEMQRQTPF